ncbi:MAG: hypothetical protein GX561_07155 [Lentisphaerae bacterium]|mgnify:FL=1|jgi:hypothetical protein|nr:hypothetical protein [Lentisphaerota bacterium]
MQSERELGPQPIDQIMTELDLENHDLVAASTEQLTHKMVMKARRGRFISMNIRLKIQRAINKASGNEYKLHDLFNYH